MTDRQADDSPAPDPTAIEYLVVTVADVVAALEATLGTGRETVLRITPPFSGRMRARLHVADTSESYEPPEPIHIDPRALVEPVPSYPTAAETAAELDDPEDINTDRHEVAHSERLTEWRETVRRSIADEATIETPAGSVSVTVQSLGGADDSTD
ncbi:hypothetical protein [Halonotius roseus]|uniref:DUF8009 domain-containing protein n=1 Tax=Halonotius roseus TaxID=2511997 RepID=A0A544QKS4_9EURY|nr:hypothetical protein [Halonotius roseus]TQQ78964.1 hypothetical protein EWF95_12595 [Halonotius roseus]